jgi:hypothetical protein
MTDISVNASGMTKGSSGFAQQRSKHGYLLLRIFPGWLLVHIDELGLAGHTQNHTHRSMASTVKRILILCKTYPSPSARHTETSCVAGIAEDGAVLRIYPVPFRLIDEDRQFKKWQWIAARVQRASDDRRRESHRIFVDTIEIGPTLSTEKAWESRRFWLQKIPTFDDFESLEASRQQEDGPTLALLRPHSVARLEVTPVGNPEWTPEEVQKLTRAQQQGVLFNDVDRDIRLLRKLPFDFHYVYTCVGRDGAKEFRHKIVDWEAGALYWNVYGSYGADWEAPFRAKLERELPARDLMFLMGTIHRFPDQWLIVSLIYPPRQPPDAPYQESLLWT